MAPISAHQCHLSAPPISAHHCCLSVPISAAYQCSIISASSSIPISVTSSVQPISAH
ncbi:unnamed protein product [Staurois parvus]|uniref:Uncharacterized protein n=1 Tax=Staurois parvus TaxID=386267 RepID=A0ABN9HM90_9NEOB|nr:unnamed protein product [Staurois parvus]